MFNTHFLEGMENLLAEFTNFHEVNIPILGQFQATNVMLLAAKSLENFCFLFCKQEEASSSIPTSHFKFNPKVYENLPMCLI